MKCPNCGNEIRALCPDDKCPFCKFLLMEHEHPFDPALYDYLKNDYLQTRNKSVSIKNGMQHFSLSMKEAKEILDFIADEVYDEENYRPSDEVNDTGKYDMKIFKFSFFQYFFRNLIFKIPLLLFMLLIAKITLDHALDFGLLPFGIWCFVNFFVIMIILYQWAIASTSEVIADSGTINYTQRLPGSSTGRELDRQTYYEAWNKTDNHYIEIVKAVDEHTNYILITGSIKQQYVTNRWNNFSSSGKRTMKQIKIPKYFKHNKELLQTLYDYKH